jgi:hypothetical protein
MICFIGRSNGHAIPSAYLAESTYGGFTPYDDFHVYVLRYFSRFFALVVERLCDLPFIRACFTAQRWNL